MFLKENGHKTYFAAFTTKQAKTKTEPSTYIYTNSIKQLHNNTFIG